MTNGPWRILVADDILPEGLALLRQAAGAQVDDLRLSRAELLACLGQYHALIVRSGTAVDRALMEHGASLRVIGRAGLAYDNIDVGAATERGIMVLNSPDAYSLAAAEHTLALLLALCRHVPATDASVPNPRRSEQVARSANNMLGGQNWQRAFTDLESPVMRNVMSRVYSPQGQRMMRQWLFAPDWLKSTVSSWTDAIAPGEPEAVRRAISQRRPENALR